MGDPSPRGAASRPGAPPTGSQAWVELERRPALPAALALAAGLAAVGLGWWLLFASPGSARSGPGLAWLPGLELVGAGLAAAAAGDTGWRRGRWRWRVGIRRADGVTECLTTPDAATARRLLARLEAPPTAAQGGDRVLPAEEAGGRSARWGCGGPRPRTASSDRWG